LVPVMVHEASKARDPICLLHLQHLFGGPVAQGERREPVPQHRRVQSHRGQEAGHRARHHGPTT
jgi:hypothetical protein